MPECFQRFPISHNQRLALLHAGIGCCVPSIKVGDGLFAKVHGRHASWQRFVPPAVFQSASKKVQEFTTPKNGSMNFPPEKKDLFLKRSSSEPTRIFQGKSLVKTGFGNLRRPGLHCFFLKSGYCGNAEPRKNQHTTCFQQKQLLQICRNYFGKRNAPKVQKTKLKKMESKTAAVTAVSQLLFLFRSNPSAHFKVREAGLFWSKHCAQNVGCWKSPGPKILLFWKTNDLKIIFFQVKLKVIQSFLPCSTDVSSISQTVYRNPAESSKGWR